MNNNFVKRILRTGKIDGPLQSQVPMPEDICDGNLLAILNAAVEKPSQKRDNILKINTDMLMKRAQDCDIGTGPWVDYTRINMDEAKKTYDKLLDELELKFIPDDVEFNRVFIVLFLLLATDNNLKLILDTVRPNMFFLRAQLNIRSIFDTASRGSVQSQYLLDTLCSYLPFWRVANVAVRRGNDEILNQVAKLIKLMMTENQQIGQKEEAWRFLIFPLVESLQRQDPDRIIKVSGECGELTNQLFFPDAKPLSTEQFSVSIAKYQACEAAFHGLLPVIVMENNDLLHHICSNAQFRDSVLEMATTVDVSNKSAIMCLSSASLLLCNLISPPRDTSDAVAMNLWHRKIALFDVPDMISRIQKAVFKFLDSFDVWKEAAATIESKVFQAAESSPINPEQIKTSVAFVPASLLHVLQSLTLVSKYHKHFHAKFYGISPVQYLAGTVDGQKNCFFSELSEDPVLWKRLLGLSRFLYSFVQLPNPSATRNHFIRLVPAVEISLFLISLRITPQRRSVPPLDPELSAASAGNLKLSGNDEFKRRNFIQAIEYYTLAIELTDCVKDDSIRIICLSNRAETYLQLQEAHRALKDAEAALKLDPKHDKSISRKQRALQMIQDNVKPLDEVIPTSPAQATTPTLNLHVKPPVWDGPRWKFH